MNIIQFSEMQNMSLQIVKSGFFGNARTEAQAITLMLIAQADNIHPMRALLEYDVINGRPAPKATTVLSRFQQKGGSVQWIESTDKKAVAKFSHPQGGEITIEWTIERAQKADLLKNDTWKKYPNQMLRARCIPEGIRAIYPAALSGMYTADEVADFTEPIKSVHDEPVFFETSIIADPSLDLGMEKKILVSKLNKLSFSRAEVREFADMFNLNEDIEAIHALNNNEMLLEEKIADFEKEFKNEN